MKGRELFYSLMYCDFKGIVPHSSAQAVAGQRYKCLVYAIYPLTCIFSVCSIFVPTYVGLVGNLINTTIAMVWMPLQAKPKSDHRVTEHSKYLVFLINKTWIGTGDWHAVRTLLKNLGLHLRAKRCKPRNADTLMPKLCLWNNIVPYLPTTLPCRIAGFQPSACRTSQKSWTWTPHWGLVWPSMGSSPAVSQRSSACRPSTSSQPPAVGRKLVLQRLTFSERWCWTWADGLRVSCFLPLTSNK